jgi:hypothetical protein
VVNLDTMAVVLVQTYWSAAVGVGFLISAFCLFLALMRWANTAFSNLARKEV